MFNIKHKGDFRHIEKSLKSSSLTNYIHVFEKYGQKGVEALAEATPKESGKTAASWEYKIQRTRRGINIVWSNTNMAGNTPVAILLQFGHATRSGSYIQGYDYINPALKPIFDGFINDIWREVTKK